MSVLVDLGDQGVKMLVLDFLILKDKVKDLRKASLEKLIAPSSTSGAMYLRVPTYHCIEEQMKKQFANLLICLIVKKGVFIG